MAITANLLMSAMLIMASLDFTVAQIGVCYGMLGDNLPCPSDVVALYKKYNIQRMRIYAPDQLTLEALSGSNIELTMDVPIGDPLMYVAACQDNADDWVQNNVINYPNVKFKHIIVGNEVNPIRKDTSQYVQHVLPAMQNVYNAVCAAGLGDQIQVSTAVDTGVLNISYPPQAGVFRSDVTPYLDPIIQFLVNTGAPLFASLYPFFAYLNDPVNVRLQYALLQPKSGIDADGVHYDNLYYALVDAMYAAVEKSVAGSCSLEESDGKKSTPEVKGSESGWSSKGHRRRLTSDDWPSKDAQPTDVATVEYARIYNNNLIRIVKNGTPKRPGRPIETYIFAMFDENQKKGNETERHFGVFLPNGQPKYHLNFS